MNSRLEEALGPGNFSRTWQVIRSVWNRKLSSSLVQTPSKSPSNHQMYRRTGQHKVIHHKAVRFANCTRFLFRRSLTHHIIITLQWISSKCPHTRGHASRMARARARRRGVWLGGIWSTCRMARASHAKPESIYHPAPHRLALGRHRVDGRSRLGLIGNGLE